MSVDVSVILPVHNGEEWLEDCLQSIEAQTFTGTLQLSIYLDSCQDGSESIIVKWKDRLGKKSIEVMIGSHKDDVGYAKNKAVSQSCGKYLCFLDCIIGSRFHREPEGSTARFTDWANTINQQQLFTQAYTSHGPTVIMPTWFCSRAVFDIGGGFCEGGKGVPEDLLFFYKHLELGGGLYRVERDLLMYRYHPGAATFSISEDTIWKHRVTFLQQQVLSKWKEFTIWNAGKQGRKLYRSLSPENQAKVIAFCDVDENKIKKGFYTYEDSKMKPKPKIPVMHFKDARPPFVICVKMGLTEGVFEENLASLNITEGVDFFHFN
ncbi:B3GNL-like protein [Mya arenaria]|uniref:B3GNL-like protein n=1 Tax=Mya arenaria TaxID=6604 RepID=A0ABY7DII3_MYAAR|nr:B3GNL-like protein [Mya arenaria]